MSSQSIIYHCGSFKLFEDLFEEGIVGISFYDYEKLSLFSVDKDNINYKELKVIIKKEKLEILCRKYIEHVEREKYVEKNKTDMF